MYTDSYEVAKNELHTLKHGSNFESCTVLVNKSQGAGACTIYRFEVKDFKVSRDRSDATSAMTPHLVSMATYFTAHNWLHPTKSHKKIVVRDQDGFVTCSVRFYSSRCAVEMILDNLDEDGGRFEFDHPYSVELEIHSDYDCVF